MIFYQKKIISRKEREEIYPKFHKNKSFIYNFRNSAKYSLEKTIKDLEVYTSKMKGGFWKLYIQVWAENKKEEIAKLPKIKGGMQ